MAKKRKRKKKEEVNVRSYLFIGLIIIIASTFFVNVEIPQFQDNSISGEVYTTALRAKENKPFRECIDSDGGTNYVKEGFVTQKNPLGNTFDIRIYYDFCDDYRINEFYCNDDNRVSSTSYVCKDGCINGKCRKP